MKDYLYCVKTAFTKHGKCFQDPLFLDVTEDDIYRLKDKLMNLTDTNDNPFYSAPYINHFLFAFKHYFKWQGKEVQISTMPRENLDPEYLE